LVVVLIPGIGHIVNGSRRWLSFGFIALQVSEFAKLGAIVYLASYLDRRENEVQIAFKGFLKPLIILGLFSILLLLEPDFGATVVLASTFMSLLFIARVPLSSFTLVFSSLVGLLGAMVVISPYRLERMTTFTNPWLTQFGSGYQLTQSLIAFGRGGVFGVGLGNSMQKLFYLPEAHTDFLFAVLSEELGLIGAIILLLFFAMLVGRMLYLAQTAIK
jgi:cell division protein FtsW